MDDGRQGVQGQIGERKDGGQAVGDGRQVAAMKKRLRELTFLHETSQLLTATLDLESVLRALIEQVREYFQVAAISVALVDDETGELVFRVAVGAAADEVMGLRLAPGQGIAGSVIRSGELQLVPVAHDDERFYAGIDEKTGFHTQTMLAVPIKLEDRAIGVIEALNPATGGFDEDAQRLLLALSDLAAVAIRNAELYERIQLAERRYESLFNQGSDPALVLDLDGMILNANQRAVEMFDSQVESLNGVFYYDLLAMSPEDGGAMIQQALAGEKPTQQVKLPPDLGGRTLEVHMAKIDFGGREAIQWLAYDISDRVALEKMRENLTHMVIHDLRTPLSSIMGSLQLIHTAYVERDTTLPVAKLLGIAMRSGQKLHLLIDSLLDLGRLETEETQLNRSLVRIPTLAYEAVEQIQPFALSKAQSVSAQIEPNLPRISIDRALIARVLSNLLDNAVKFTRRGGSIELRAMQSDGDILFTVADTGIGIPAEHQEHIFQRFTRLEEADGVKGTGLGLAFCKLTVEAHGGRIWVESEPDKGSEFKFTLPLEAA